MRAHEWKFDLKAGLGVKKFAGKRNANFWKISNKYIDIF
jgi:hypothetical protein